MNGEALVFPSNRLLNVTKIDERNLGSTRWLNLAKSSVSSLDGAHLKNLEYLSTAVS